MLRKIDRIAIIGGGTAAWLAAAYLTKNTDFDITVVDKEIGSPVGVGEGTLLHFDYFLEKCGFEKSEWMLDCDATYKAGILFPEFGKNDSLIWHPFILNILYDRYNSSLYEALTYTDKTKFNELSAFFEISMENKVDTENLNAYAYHIDCGKLIQFIQNKIKNRLTFVKSEVIEIYRNSQNNIKHVKCANGKKVCADLFIDCTGFNKILKNNSKKVDLTDRLFVDTAVAAHVQYQNLQVERHPYVVSHAVDHGWIWNIPTYSRIGTGLVFNRSVTNAAQAAEYLCDYWEGRISIDDCKFIDWTPYYDENPWENNVISLGLSAGFIEPLESTGVATITQSIRNIVNTLASGYYTRQDIKLYNQYHINLFEEAVDFVNMHYAQCSIDSDFWNSVKDRNKLSEVYYYYKDMIINGEKLNNEGKGYLFGGANWLCWMYQILDNYPKNKNINEKTAEIILNDWKQTVQTANSKDNTIPHGLILDHPNFR